MNRLIVQQQLEDLIAIQLQNDQAMFWRLFEILKKYMAEFEAMDFRKSPEDLKAYGWLAHKLRTSFKIFGANPLAQLLLEIEYAVHSGNHELIDSHLFLYHSTHQQVLHKIETVAQNVFQGVAPIDPPPLHVAQFKPKILIVDDDLVITELLKFMLDRAGYTTDHRLDEAGAQAALKRETYHLIILDITMQRLNGLNFIEQLKKNAPLKAVPIPILVLASSFDKSTVLKAKTLGAHDYVIKPPTREDLLSLVSHILKLAQKQNAG